MPQPTLKLHAYLAQQGLTSRRKAEVMIAEGKVKVNGLLAYVGQRIDPKTDKIFIQGKLFKPQTTFQYYVVNKPIGYVSTAEDELGRKTVVDLLPDFTERLYPVGRLDKDSEGLMLLTNDGELAYRLTHPKFEVAKTYKVLVNAEPTEKALDFLRRGVKLKEGMTRPAEVELLKDVEEGAWLQIQIHEGKQHQVRRMLERAGYDTVRLIRTQIGPISLKDVHGRKYHELPTNKVAQLRKSVGLN